MEPLHDPVVDGQGAVVEERFALVEPQAMAGRGWEVVAGEVADFVDGVISNSGARPRSNSGARPRARPETGP